MYTILRYFRHHSKDTVPVFLRFLIFTHNFSSSSLFFQVTIVLSEAKRGWKLIRRNMLQDLSETDHIKSPASRRVNTKIGKWKTNLNTNWHVIRTVGVGGDGRFIPGRFHAIINITTNPLLWQQLSLLEWNVNGFNYLLLSKKATTDRLSPYIIKLGEKMKIWNFHYRVKKKII